MLRPRGFRHLALEIGPQDASLLTTLAGANMPSRLNDFRTAQATTFPFYSKYTSDAELLELVPRNGLKLWGLDQQFIFSSTSQLKRLTALATTTNARNLVQSFYRTDVEAARADSANGASSTRFLRRASEQDFSALQAAYRDGPPEAREIITELEKSAVIYRANAAGLATSNVLRSRLMKQHLRSYYDAATKRDGSPPKVLFKLGAMHAGRGLSWLDVYDVGNAVSELAELHGQTSYHIGFWSGEALLMHALDGMPAGVWAVVDFIGLRERLALMAKGGTNPEIAALAELAKRYDAFIVAPSLTKSALLR